MSMRMLLVVAVLLGWSASATAEPHFDKVKLSLTKVRGNVYLLTGAGGNIAVDNAQGDIVGLSKYGVAVNIFAGDCAGELFNPQIAVDPAEGQHGLARQVQIKRALGVKLNPLVRFFDMVVAFDLYACLCPPADG